MAKKQVTYDRQSVLGDAAALEGAVLSLVRDHGPERLEALHDLAVGNPISAPIVKRVVARFRARGGKPAGSLTMVARTLHRLSGKGFIVTGAGRKWSVVRKRPSKDGKTGK
jgi:hypothetical protein